MRALYILSGIAVLITSLHLVHAIHHFYAVGSQAGMHGAALWSAMLAAIVIDVLSFIGGCLLLRRTS
jgi:uncharacterized membrane protein